MSAICNTHGDLVLNFSGAYAQAPEPTRVQAQDAVPTTGFDVIKQRGGSLDGGALEDFGSYRVDAF